MWLQGINALPLWKDMIWGEGGKVSFVPFGHVIDVAAPDCRSGSLSSGRCRSLVLSLLAFECDTPPGLPGCGVAAGWTFSSPCLVLTIFLLGPGALCGLVFCYILTSGRSSPVKYHSFHFLMSMYLPCF